MKLAPKSYWTVSELIAPTLHERRQPGLLTALVQRYPFFAELGETVVVGE